MTFLYSKADGAIITNSHFSLLEAVSKYFNISPHHVWVFLVLQSTLGSEVSSSVRSITVFPTFNSHWMSKSVWRRITMKFNGDLKLSPYEFNLALRVYLLDGIRGLRNSRRAFSGLLRELV